MTDFASAAMLRVMRCGLQRLGLPVPELARSAQATLPLETKRAVVQAAVARRGLAVMVQLGQGAHDLHDEPLLPLLVRPGEPWHVLQAWLRLERYLHSRHRVRQTLVDERCAALERYTTVPGEWPHPAEDLLVLGLLVALLQRCGCEGVWARLGDGTPVWPPGAGGADAGGHGDAAAVEAEVEAAVEAAVLRAAQAGATRAWRLGWARCAAPGGVTPATPEAAQTASIASAASTASTASAVSRLHAWLAADEWPAQPPTLTQAAAALGLSVRGLQRALDAEGTHFSELMARWRIGRASALLAGPEPALATVGFICGYTDQAHFTRDFRRRVGLTPLKFRESARPAAGAGTRPRPLPIMRP